MNDIKFGETFTFQTHMITVPRRECGNVQKVLCAKEDDGYVCVGDSGGPAVADRDRDGTWVQYGITQFGYGDCGDATDGNDAFVDVSAYVDEILVQIQNNS